MRRPPTEPIERTPLSLAWLRIGIALGLLACLPNLISAQDSDSTATLKPIPAGPDTSIWIDDSGTPRPVLGVTFEEFNQAWQAYQGQLARPTSPNYVVQQIQITGQQCNGYFDLDAEIQIQLTHDKLTRVTLGLGNVPLSAPPAGLQERETFSYSAEASAWTTYLQGGGTRTLRVPMLLPIRTTGQRKEIQLLTPKANSFRMEVLLASAATQVTSSEGVIAKLDTENDSNRLQVLGGSGRIRVGWNSTQRDNRSFQPVLTAIGELATEIHGGGARTQAKITVKSFGGPVEQFSIRLPPKARLIPPAQGNQTLYTVRTLEHDSLRQTCQITLPEKSTGPIAVDLACEQPFSEIADQNEDQQEADAIDLAGFEVLGAIRQSGEIALSVAPDFRLRWGELTGARRISLEELSPGLKGLNATAGVRYFRSGYAIPVRLLRQSTQVKATTRYQLNIAPDQSILKVTGDFQINGPPVSQFDFDLADWQDTTSDQIEPAGIVDSQRVYVSADGTLEIPLAKPQSAPVAIEFSAKKALPLDGEPFELALPRAVRPITNLVGRSELIVVVDPSLEAEILPSPNLQLEPLPASSLDAENPFRRFRVLSDFSWLGNQPLLLKARVSRRPAELNAEIQSQVAIRGSACKTTQSFRFEILNEPMQTLTLSGPSEIFEAEDIDFSLSTPGEEDRQRFPANWRVEQGKLMIELPRPWLGEILLTASYTQPLNAEDSNRLRVHLLTPDNVSTLLHKLKVCDRAGLSWMPESSDSPWTSMEQSGELATDQTATVASLASEPTKGAPADAVVQRVWRQTWIRGGQLQQRTAWRATFHRSSVNLKVSPEFSSRDTEVLINGQRSIAQSHSPTLLSVPLPDTIQGQLTTLELRQVKPIASFDVQNLAIQPVMIEGENAFPLCYWQVILPKKHLLLGAPPGFVTAESLASPVFFNRNRSSESAKYESWAGATSMGMVPAANEQAYLFSSMAASNDKWKVRNVNRSLATLLASTIVLALGMIVAYTPAAWRPSAAMAMLLFLGLAATQYPQETMLFCQLGTIGLAAVMVGWLTVLFTRESSSIPVILADDSTEIRLGGDAITEPVPEQATSIALGVSTASMQPPRGVNSPE